MKIVDKIVDFKYPLIVLLLSFIGYLLRSHGIDWDQGYHMHPDERAIVMFTTPITLPQSIGEFFSPTSTLNPHFFAYGSFPIYLLKLSGFIFSSLDPLFGEYAKIQIIGRTILAIMDSLLIVIIYLFSKKFFNNSIALLAAFFYMAAVFPIQLSHFYTVDPFLSFFLFVSMYFLLSYYRKQTLQYLSFSGIFFGFALASKISGTIFFVPILSVFALLFLIQKKQGIVTTIKKLLAHLLLFASITTITVVLLEPYVLIDFQTFLAQTQEQSQMTKNAYIFPFTLQYVSKIPFVHEFYNVLFGFGILPTMLSFSGIVISMFFFRKKRDLKKYGQLLVVLLFFFLYLTTISLFKVGWMRYSLPLYPYLAIFAGYFVFESLPRGRKMRITILSTVIFLTILWTLSFMSIYFHNNTRIQATTWIHEHVPFNATIAIEHWDDRVPIMGGERYRFEELTLYDYPDSETKWIILNQKLERSDYIVIASNRLYEPLTTLSDCKKYERCYPTTAQYYQNLFDEKLGFYKIAEFTSPPTVPFLNISIDDQSADESFTVYDHPKIVIFKRK